MAAGTAWAIGGVSAVQSGLLTIVAASPLLLLLSGVGVLVRVAVPRGALAGPLTLITAGAAWVSVQYGLLRGVELDRVVSAVLIVGGIAVAFIQRPDQSPVDSGIQHFRTILVPIERKPRRPTPTRLHLLTVLGAIQLDLSRARFPTAYEMEVDISVFYGRVRLRLPADWTVVAGRVAAAHGVRFEGDLDSNTPVVGGQEKGDVERSDDPLTSQLLVLNILGLGGTESIDRSGH